MTEQQYNRAIAIYERINDLVRVKKEIAGTEDHRLSYTWKTSSREWSVCDTWDMMKIGEILDKHDLMIRQEIDEEIERLKAEIKRL